MADITLQEFYDATLKAGNIVPVQEPTEFVSVPAGDTLDVNVNVSDCKAIVVGTILQEQFTYRVDLRWKLSNGAVFGGAATTTILESQSIGNRVSDRFDVLTPLVAVTFHNEHTAAHSVKLNIYKVMWF